VTGNGHLIHVLLTLNNQPHLWYLMEFDEEHESYDIILV